MSRKICDSLSPEDFCMFLRCEPSFNAIFLLRILPGCPALHPPPSITDVSIPPYISLSSAISDYSTRLTDLSLPSCHCSQKQVTGITDIELKVKEATNSDAWGASGTVSKEIARATFN